MRETDQVIAFWIASMIGFVLLPSLSWATVTPEMWLASVRQAQEVKRIKWAEQLEDLAWKAYYARTRSILSAGLANTTVAQRQEVAGFLLATARAQPREVMEVLRHKSIRTTMDVYGHMFPENVRETVNDLNDDLDRLAAGGEG